MTMKHLQMLVRGSGARAVAAGAAEAGNARRREGARASSSAASTPASPASPAPDDQGNWTGLDVDYCRAVAAAIFGDPTKVAVHAAHRQGALHRAAVGRGRRAVAQHDLDASTATPRSASTSPASTTTTARASWCRKALGVASAHGAGRRLGLRADRHHDRAQPRRLLPRQQHGVQAGRLREERRGRARPIDEGRCDVYTTDASGLAAERSALAEPGRPHHPARDHLQGAARPGGAPGRRRSGATSCAGRSTRWSRPRSSASPRRTSTR